MQAYAEYKDSGVDWLGVLPTQWEVKRLKFLCSIGTGERNTEDKIDGGKYPFYVRSQKAEKINSYSFDGEAILTAGDGAGVGKVYHYVDGKFDFHQRVYKFSNFNGIFGKYLFHYISNTFYSVAVLGTAKTTVDSLRLPLIQDFWISFPFDTSEQAAITNFLDDKVAKIDELVKIKRRQIALLGERKKILIQNAVTKGLNLNAPMKDSGVKWIGTIPAHWEVKPAKHLFFEVDERSENGDEELLSVSHMTGVTPRSEKTVSMFLAEDYSGSKICRDRDLVFNIMWAWMGALGVSSQVGIVSPSYAVFRQLKFQTFNHVYLEMLMQSLGYIEHYNKVSTGLHSSRLRFYSHMFLSMKIGYPSFEEQERIVKFLAKETGKISKAVSVLESQITKLNEYKTTLINAAVTGKIKVA